MKRFLKSGLLGTLGLLATAAPALANEPPCEGNAQIVAPAPAPVAPRYYGGATAFAPRFHDAYDGDRRAFERAEAFRRQQMMRWRLEMRRREMARRFALRHARRHALNDRF